MKRYRIVYWSCLNRTAWVLKAKTRNEAIAKFRKLKGKDIRIIQVSECIED